MVYNLENLLQCKEQLSRDSALSPDLPTVTSLAAQYCWPVLVSAAEISKIPNFDNVSDYIQQGYFPFYNDKGDLCYAITNLNNLGYFASIIPANSYIFLAESKLFPLLLEKHFAHISTIKAKYHLDFLDSKATAKNIDYRKMVIGFILAFITFFASAASLFNLFNNILYFTQNAFKTLLFLRAVKDNVSKDEQKHLLLLENNDLPVYTIMVPLYKEVNKLKAIIAAMQRLNYPKDKLDVKFIIEADDLLTIHALAVLEMPEYIHIIKVPYSLPRTKPKALNYAMNFIKGKYLTIYDAEDEPEPDQLLKALYAFSVMPENYVCMQARLNFYNAKENILTRLFSMEYTIWFNFLLKGLSLFDLPVTLGGTSNHFKVQPLKEVGYWDAYNVTEDADLGIRLYSKGYKVHIIDSETLEESPSDLSNWLQQRSRWIKGFIQTLLIFWHKEKDYKIFPLHKVITVYIFVGLSSYSFFLLPWLLFITFAQIDYSLYYSWVLNGVFTFIYMYGSAAYIQLQRKESGVIDWFALMFWPLYFILHTAASYRALWECFAEPFKWNKTHHGSIKDV